MRGCGVWSDRLVGLGRWGGGSSFFLFFGFLLGSNQMFGFGNLKKKNRGPTHKGKCCFLLFVLLKLVVFCE